MPKLIAPEKIVLSFGSIVDSSTTPVEYVRGDIYEHMAELLNKSTDQALELVQKYSDAQQRIEDLSKEPTR